MTARAPLFGVYTLPRLDERLICRRDFLSCRRHGPDEQHEKRRKHHARWMPIQRIPEKPCSSHRSHFRGATASYTGIRFVDISFRTALPTVKTWRRDRIGVPDTSSSTPRSRYHKQKARFLTSINTLRATSEANGAGSSGFICLRSLSPPLLKAMLAHKTCGLVTPSFLR
jgi:hypothetical protein